MVLEVVERDMGLLLWIVVLFVAASLDAEVLIVEVEEAVWEDVWEVAERVEEVVDHFAAAEFDMGCGCGFCG